MSAALLACCGLVLLASAWSHVRRPRELASGLAAHRVLPPGLRTPLALALTAVEVVLGVAALGAALLGFLPLAVAAGAAAAVLFLLMAGYLLVARRVAPAGVPCACGLGDAPLGPWVTVRALALAALAAVAAGSATLALSAPAPAWGLTGRPLDQVVVLASAAVALALGLGLLPAARQSLDALPLATGGAR